jgi:hypothetical protein
MNPTFAVCKRKEVTDLPLATNNINNLVNNWHISDEPSLLDHRNQYFQVGKVGRNLNTFRDLKRTNWESYKDDLRARDIFHGGNNQACCLLGYDVVWF